MKKILLFIALLLFFAFPFSAFASAGSFDPSNITFDSQTLTFDLSNLDPSYDGWTVTNIEIYDNELTTNIYSSDNNPSNVTCNSTLTHCSANMVIYRPGYDMSQVHLLVWLNSAPIPYYLSPTIDMSSFPTPTPTPTATPTPTPTPQYYNITGNVYIDANRNGTKDNGESNSVGTTVDLSGASSQSATTDSNGNYAFPNSIAGDYHMNVVSPTGYIGITVGNINFTLNNNATYNFGIALEPSSTTMFSDDFTDTDGTALTDHDSNWTVPEGSAIIQNNALYGGTNGFVVALPNFDLADQCASYDALFPLPGLIDNRIKISPLDFHNLYHGYINTNYNSSVRWANFTNDISLAGNDNVSPSAGWHNFKVCAAGSDIAVVTAYLDNTLLEVGFDGPPHYTHGYAAINAGPGQYLDNFKFELLNQAPQVTDISNTTLNEGATYSADGSFTDTNSSSWTATVNYGDGSGVQPLTLDSDKTFFLSHLYKDNGTYTVTVSVTDNQGAVGTATATVTVNNVAPTVGNITVSPSPAHINESVSASASFTDPGVLDTHTATLNWGDGTPEENGTVTESNGSGSVTDTHTYTNFGTYTITLTVKDKDNATGNKTTTITVVKQITILNPAEVWLSKGLLNIGLRLDVLAEAYKDTTLVSSGQINSVTAGSGGFNSADLVSIPFNSFSPVDFPQGSQLKLKLSVRNACSGSLPNQGTARLWFNDNQANSHFGATIGTTNNSYYLLDNFFLSTTVGVGPRQNIDVAAGAKCSPFKTFGTWTITP